MTGWKPYESRGLNPTEGLRRAGSPSLLQPFRGEGFPAGLNDSGQCRRLSLFEANSPGDGDVKERVAHVRGLLAEGVVVSTV